MKSQWTRREFLKTTTCRRRARRRRKNLGCHGNFSAETPPRARPARWFPASASAPARGSVRLRMKTLHKRLLEKALASGINYFDTAGSYTGAASNA